MNLADLGLEGVAMPPRATAVFHKLLKEVERLKRQKVEDDRTLKELHREFRQLSTHSAMLQQRLDDTYDALSALQTKATQELHGLSRENISLISKVDNLKEALRSVTLEKDEMGEAVANLISRFEDLCSDTVRSPLDSSVSQTRLVMHSPLAPSVRRHDDPPIYSDGPALHQYAAALISSLTSKLEQTQEALEILEEDSEVNISVLEAQVAQRDAQLQANLIENGRTAGNDLRSPATRSMPKRRDPSEAGFGESLRGRALEDDVRRIARKLEQVELLTAQTINPDITTPRPFLHDLSLPEATVEISPTVPLSAQPAAPPDDVHEAEPEHELPRSPRLLSVLRDVETEISRLSEDLAGLRFERERVLILGRAKPTENSRDQEGPAMQDGPSSLPNHLNLVEEECIRLRQSEAASKRLLDQLRDESNVVDPGQPYLVKFEDAVAEGNQPADETTEQGYNHWPVHPLAVDVNSSHPVDWSAVQRQLTDAQFELEDKNNQLEQLKGELDALLVKEHG